MKRALFAALIVMTLTLISCSNGNNSNPVAPALDSPDNPYSPPGHGEAKVLIYGVMNLETGTVEIKERYPEQYLDVTSIIGSNFSYTINGIVTPPDTLDIDLTINNVSALTVHNVCIVFDELYGKTVVNPNIHLDIFEPYDINPAIEFYYWDVEREFPPGERTEKLYLKYPGGNPMIDFFIIAHLGGNTGGVYSLTAGLLGRFYPDGGTAELSAVARDYQDDVTFVISDTTFFNNAFTNLVNDPGTYNWKAEIENENLVPAGIYPTLVAASSPASPAYNTYYYAQINVYVPGEEPTYFDYYADDIAIDGDTEFDDTYMLSSGRRSLAYSGHSFYLVFWSYTDPDEGAVYFTKSVDNGETWTTATPVTDERNGNIESLPGIAANPTAIYVVYESELGVRQDVMLSKSNDEGETWTHFNVSQTPVGTELSPTVCIEPSRPDVVHVAYIDQDAQTCMSAASESTDLLTWDYGVVSGSPYDHDAITPSNAYSLDSQLVMVAYSDIVEGETGRRLYFATSSDGIVWNKAALITHNYEVDQEETEPSLAVNPSTGVPGILYRSGLNFKQRATFIKAEDSTALMFNEEVCVAICHPDAPAVYETSLCVEVSGRWLCTFYNRLGSTRNIHLYESIDDGETWSMTMYHINDDYSNTYAENSSIVSNGNDVIVAWTDTSEFPRQVYLDHGTHR